MLDMDAVRPIESKADAPVTNAKAAADERWAKAHNVSLTGGGRAGKGVADLARNGWVESPHVAHGTRIPKDGCYRPSSRFSSSVVRDLAPRATSLRASSTATCSASVSGSSSNGMAMSAWMSAGNRARNLSRASSSSWAVMARCLPGMWRTPPESILP